MMLNSIITNQLNSSQNNLILVFPFIITIAEANSKKGKKALQSSMIFTVKWFDNTILFSLKENGNAKKSIISTMEK